MAGYLPRLLRPPTQPCCWPGQTHVVSTTRVALVIHTPFGGTGEVASSVFPGSLVEASLSRTGTSLSQSGTDVGQNPRTAAGVASSCGAWTRTRTSQCLFLVCKGAATEPRAERGQEAVFKGLRNSYLGDTTLLRWRCCGGTLPAKMCPSHRRLSRST